MFKQLRNQLRRANRAELAFSSRMGVIGLILLAACAYLTYSNVTLLRTGYRASGTVMNKSCYRGDCTSLIAYVDNSGVSREKTTASSNLSSSSVEILFHQQPEMLPTDVSINTFGMMWIAPLFLALFGSIVSFVSLCLFVQSLPPMKRKPGRQLRRGSSIWNVR